MRWLVLVVILLGAFVSSMGSTNSHGIAAIAAKYHAPPSYTESARGHAHEHVNEHSDAGSAMASQVAVDDHPHHGADHSHDKAHAPRAAWNLDAQLLPVRFAIVRPWIEWVHAFRLERPPMG